MDITKKYFRHGLRSDLFVSGKYCVEVRISVADCESDKKPTIHAQTHMVRFTNFFFFFLFFSGSLIEKNNTSSL